MKVRCCCQLGAAGEEKLKGKAITLNEVQCSFHMEKCKTKSRFKTLGPAKTRVLVRRSNAYSFRVRVLSKEIRDVALHLTHKEISTSPFRAENCFVLIQFETVTRNHELMMRTMCRSARSINLLHIVDAVRRSTLPKDCGFIHMS